MEALLALVVMTSIDDEPWRWLLGLSAVPLLLVILVLPVSCKPIVAEKQNHSRYKRAF